MSEIIAYSYVDNTESEKELLDLIETLTEKDYIAIDTEFIRVRTFYPIFALLQLKIRDLIFIVDPKALCLKRVLKAINSTKAFILMFSCEEDLEVMYQASYDLGLEKCLPDRIYDVQLLCAFEGSFYKPGLYRLINDFLGIGTDKDCSLTDWEARPLSVMQLNYAAGDVAYLYDLFIAFKDRVDDRKFSWFEKEMQLVVKDNTELTDPDMLYRFVAGAGSLNNIALNRLRFLCKKRYELGVLHNAALNQIITTKALCLIAQTMPQTKKDLIKTGLKYGCLKEWGDVILKLCSQALEHGEDRSIPLPFDSFMHSGNHKVYIKKLKDHLKQIATKEMIAPELLNAKRYIQDFFLQDRDGEAILQSSWRLECCRSLSGYKMA